jgi:hypothetical protein
MSLSVDYSGLPNQPPESLREQVQRILEKNQATFPNFISATPDEKLYADLDLASVPAVFVYGPDGQLAKRFDNDSGEYGEEGFRYTEHVVPLVELLLPR